MNEFKIIKILTVSTLIFCLAGTFLLWQKDWFAEGFYSASILEMGRQKLEQVSFFNMLTQLSGLGEEKTYLILFQNNLELRPSGGYLGNFGILKLENGQINYFETHDTNIFDGFGKVQTTPPLPMSRYLGITNWQMRDSNWSPDFPTAAQQAEYFYHQQGGQEQFDGIIAVNAAVLPDLLALLRPIYLEEFDKEFNASDVLYQLEYEVEKGYFDRGLRAGERKKIFKALIKEVVKRITDEQFSQKAELRKLLLNELNEKNIILFSKNQEVQEAITKINWAGQVKQFEGDYLMINEANLGAKKSNYFIKRKITYSVDWDKRTPLAQLKIHYIHQGSQRDWFNDDYRAYLRVYLPKGSWLLEAKGVSDKTVFLDELDKAVFGNWIIIPTGQEKTIEFKYLLPERIRQNNHYRLLIQKQSGIDKLPLVLIFKRDQKEIKLERIIKSDWVESIPD